MQRRHLPLVNMSHPVAMLARRFVMVTFGIPVLAPYATMDQDDVDQCMEDAEEGRVAMDVTP